VKYRDPSGLWTVSIEGYVGLGGGIAIHGCGNPLTGSGRISAVTLSFGKGIGIQGVLDPLGKAPGAGNPASYEASIGVYGNAGVGLGIPGLGIGVNANAGGTTNMDEQVNSKGRGPFRPRFPFNPYGDIDLQLPLGISSGVGRLGASAGIGVQVTGHTGNCK
jgi:hypothetical protein